MGELVAVHVDADVAQVQGDAVEDVGDAVGGRRSICSCAVCSSTEKAERITTLPRSKGPTVAGLIVTSESGWPL